jgi:hypothetical protein
VRAHVLEAPFSDRTQSLTVLGTALKVLPLEPVVWISQTRPEVTELPRDAPRFPAVVDTGHAGSLSIQRRTSASSWTRGRFPSWAGRLP